MRLFGRRNENGLETSGDRRALAADAGWGAVSGWSVLAGTLTAYGSFAVLVAAAAAVLASTDIEAELSALNWDELGAAGAVVVALVAFAAYFFGGYTAGRMARRAGATNGVLVSVFGVLLAVALGAMAAATTDTDVIAGNLRTVGVPTTSNEWGAVGTVAGIATLVAMITGSMLGGAAGDRWHSRLLRRAIDPSVGTEADLRAQAAHDLEEAETRRLDTPGRLHRATGGRASAMSRSDDDRDASGAGSVTGTSFWRRDRGGDEGSD